MTWTATVKPYIVQRRKDNLMGGVEVHEHQLFLVLSDGSHLVGAHADPVYTCQEVSGDGDRIKVEGNDVWRPTTYLQRNFG